MSDQQIVFSCEDRILAEVSEINIKLDKLLGMVADSRSTATIPVAESHEAQPDATQLKLTVKAFTKHLQDNGYKKASYLQIQLMLLSNGIIARRIGTKRSGEPLSGYELTAKGNALPWIESAGNGTIWLLTPMADCEIIQMLDAAGPAITGRNP